MYPKLVRHCVFFFFSSRRRHTRSLCDWSSDVCSSDLAVKSPRQFASISVALGEDPHRGEDHAFEIQRQRPVLDVVDVVHRSEERRVGKSLDLVGRRDNNKKKNKRYAEDLSDTETTLDA